MYAKGSANGNVNVFTVGDMVDKAIIHLASNRELGRLSLQKGVFLYLLSVAARKGYDADKVLNIAGFEPYRYGPFSEFLNGEVEQLGGYGEIRIIGTGESQKVKTVKESLKDYKLDGEEKLLMENIKDLIDKLQPMELTFYVYFNPAFDKKIRDFFTTKSEIKDRLMQEREKYVKRLMRKNILDEDAANLILYAEPKD